MEPRAIGRINSESKFNVSDVFSVSTASRRDFTKAVKVSHLQMEQISRLAQWPITFSSRTVLLGVNYLVNIGSDGTPNVGTLSTRICCFSLL